MKHWISAMRLRTLPLALSCIITGSACAAIIGGFEWTIFLMAIITTILLQILSNLANDYGDGVKGTDKHRIGPERMVQTGKISLKAMKKGILICALFAFISGILLIYSSDLSFYKSIVFVMLGFASLGAAVFYTIGDIPYGYRALGDIMVLIFFGLVGVMGVFYLFIHVLNFSVILPALCIGFCAAAVLHLNNMRDSSNDYSVGKITIANKLGIQKSKIYFHVLIITALVSMFLFVYMRNHLLWNDFIFVLIYPFFLFTSYKVQKVHEEIQFDQFLKPIAIGTFVLSFLFALSIYL